MVREDLVLDRACRDEPVDEDGARLAKAERAEDRLRVRRRVPPAVIRERERGGRRVRRRDGARWRARGGTRWPPERPRAPVAARTPARAAVVRAATLPSNSNRRTKRRNATRERWSAVTARTTARAAVVRAATLPSDSTRRAKRRSDDSRRVEEHDARRRHEVEAEIARLEREQEDAHL